MAGQTIPHVHMHLIPRYVGDTENPRGGVSGRYFEAARLPVDAVIELPAPPAAILPRGGVQESALPNTPNSTGVLA
ncbi:hypothetical protein [Cupriavidus sp. BIC8F]|uniref:HIT family protein n=1 Tax=Cupriavidus sp. BIC8F TaxID=3079014 RepID=UPI0029164AD8|nr:hypothetical protein [Cupriavidus sp. BIC8F]